MISLKNTLVVYPRYSICLFIFLFCSSILFYSGGTLHNPSTIGYSFTRNFFSDLGILSQENIISVILFAMGLLVVGLNFILYFYSFMKLFNANTFIGKIGKVGSIFGIIGAIFFIIIGFTPHNFVHDSHIIAVNWAFRSFCLASLLLFYSMYNDSRFEWRYALGYLIFSLLIFFYIIVLEFGPSPRDSDFSLVFNVIAQKIIVLVFVLSVFYQSFGNASFLNKHNK
tara:strand:- start:6865 stop:7542 length:678 start_codon:yes stop_codon:yes gene_type:complete